MLAVLCRLAFLGTDRENLKDEFPLWFPRMPAKYQEAKLFIWAHHAKTYNNRYCMFGAKTVSKSIKLIELALNNVVVPRARQIHCRSVFYNFILSWFDLFVLTWHRKGLSMFLSVTVRDFREKIFNIKLLISPVAFLSPLKPKTMICG